MGRKEVCDLYGAAARCGASESGPGYHTVLGTLSQDQRGVRVVMGSQTVKVLPRGPEDVRKTLAQWGSSEPQILFLFLSSCLVARQSPAWSVALCLPSGQPNRHLSRLGRRGGVWLPCSLNSFNMILVCSF